MNRARRIVAARVGRWLWIVTAAVGVGVHPAAARAQSAAGNIRIEIGVDPARVRVGEPFRTAVRVVAPAGYTAAIGDFAGTDSLGVVAPTVAGAADGEGVAAVYTLAAWIAGTPLAAAVPVRVTGQDGTERTISVDLRLPDVESVLPAAGEPVAPRPPRGPMPMPVPSTFPAWWWLLAVIGAAVSLAVAYWRLSRERDRELGETLADPREWALAQLGAAGAAPVADAAGAVATAERVSRVLRAYLERVDRVLGRDLTTTELLNRFAADERNAAFFPSLRDLLGSADLVKFAGQELTPAGAERMLSEAREWVTDYPPAETADRVARAA